MRVWSARRGLDLMFAATSARCPSPRNRSRAELPALTKPRVAASTKAVTTAWTSALSLQAWSSKTECDDPRLAGTCSSCRAGISATSVADQLCAASGAERAGGAPWPAPDPAACSRSALSGARDREGRRYQRGRKSMSLALGCRSDICAAAERLLYVLADRAGRVRGAPDALTSAVRRYSGLNAISDVRSRIAGARPDGSRDCLGRTPIVLPGPSKPWPGDPRGAADDTG